MTKTRLALACLLLSSGSALASSPPGGTVHWACGSPAPTVRNIPVLKDRCGVKITGVTQNGNFTLTPAVDADLDIHFFNTSDVAINHFASFGCGAVSGQTPNAASYAVVVLTPSTCPIRGQSEVPFTYSD